MGEIKKVTVTTVEIGIDELLYLILKEAGLRPGADVKFLDSEGKEINTINKVRAVYKKEVPINKPLTRSEKIDVICQPGKVS